MDRATRAGLVSITVTLEVEPRLPARRARELGGELAQGVSMQLLGSTTERGSGIVTWMLAADGSEPASLAPTLLQVEAVARELATGVAGPDSTVRTQSLEGRTAAQVERMIEATGRSSTPVSVEEFRELLGGVSRQRLYALQKEDPLFPKPFGRGLWYRAVAEDYANFRDPKPGRPVSRLTRPGYREAAYLTAAGERWREAVPQGARVESRADGFGDLAVVLADGTEVLRIGSGVAGGWIVNDRSLLDGED